nr:hypothetical protein [Hoeflea sp.]
MLLLLAEYLQQFHKGFAVFQYLTLRGILGVLTALSLALWLGPWMIRTLQIRQIGQAVRNDGPQSHLSKSGTPTMGGALILSAIAISETLKGLGSFSANLSEHPPLILVGDGRSGHWTRYYGFTDPNVLIGEINRLSARRVHAKSTAIAGQEAQP